MTQICNKCIKNNKLLYTTYIIENIDIDEIDDIFYKYINIHNQKFIFDKIIKVEINMISCRCNMSYKYYMNTTMSMLERRINSIISRNPKLINCLNRNKNHPPIKNYTPKPV